MRKLAAHVVLDENFVPQRNAILLVNDQMQVVELRQSDGSLMEEARLEFYPGMIVPYGNELLEPDTRTNHTVLLARILGLQEQGMALPEILHKLVKDPANKEGLILVQDLDLENLRLSQESKLLRLI